MDSIPLLDLKAQYASIREEVRDAIDRVMNSQHFILGPEVAALEREVAEYCQCRYAVGVSSGTDALLVVLMALGVRPGDEVITSAYSFLATASAIARLGATPVFVDIEHETFNIDPHGIEKKITPRTRAIMPVHLFGQMADMDRILETASRHKLPVIEDAAQAIGAESGGRRAGGMGMAACLSFYPTKNLGGAGDGGMITTNNTELAERLRMLRDHGFKKRYHAEILGETSGSTQFRPLFCASSFVIWTVGQRPGSAMLQSTGSTCHQRSASQLRNREVMSTTSS